MQISHLCFPFWEKEKCKTGHLELFFFFFNVLMVQINLSKSSRMRCPSCRLKIYSCLVSLIVSSVNQHKKHDAQTLCVALHLLEKVDCPLKENEVWEDSVLAKFLSMFS